MMIDISTNRCLCLMLYLIIGIAGYLFLGDDTVSSDQTSIKIRATKVH